MNDFEVNLKLMGQWLQHLDEQEADIDARLARLSGQNETVEALPPAAPSPVYTPPAPLTAPEETTPVAPAASPPATTPEYLANEADDDRWLEELLDEDEAGPSADPVSASNRAANGSAKPLRF